MIRLSMLLSDVHSVSLSILNSPVKASQLCYLDTLGQNDDGSGVVEHASPHDHARNDTWAQSLLKHYVVTCNGWEHN